MYSIEERKKPKLAVNFGPLKKGGGHNVALNFVFELKRREETGFDLFFIVCESSALKRELEDSKWKDKLCIVSKNPVKRIFQELTVVTKFLKKNGISWVYSYFGFAFLPARVKQIIGSADSNLYFPEIDFWREESQIEKVRRYFVDQYRIFGLKTAFGVIYENDAMYHRAEALFGITSKSLIRPSITTPDKNDCCALTERGEGVRVLLLCGWQRNKNILLVPRLAHELKKLKLNVEFVITASADGSSCAEEFFSEVSQWEVADKINCIGQVDKNELSDLYDKIDFVLLLSLLESFSNNIIEAWHFGKPLIISDEMWARSICGNAALYVDRDNAICIAREIVKLYKKEARRKELISSGKMELSKFPTVGQRLEQEFQFIESLVK
ncbi:MAG TPA: glycosyltransferase family 1 protein [Rhodospirillales bacterium]|nr:glycosyltransferase family 1 protein [Rhodospirillales bacterium]